MTATTSTSTSRNASGGRVSRNVVLPYVALVALTVWGASYYFGSAGVRVRHDLHDLLRPSGLVGQTAGILTFLGFAFLWLYPMRKKWPRLKWPGSMPWFLDVHIVVGLTVPLLGAVHAAWRFEGLIGLGYWAMLVVALSGVVGRYVYVRIPRGRSGLELSAEEIAQQRRQLLVDLAGITGLEQAVVESVLAADPVSREQTGLLSSLVRMVKDDFARKRAVKKLQRHWEQIEGNEGTFDSSKLEEVARLARRQMALTQQTRLLGQTQAILGHWHTLHRPVAITAFLAVTIHVVVVVYFGATWFY